MKSPFRVGSLETFRGGLLFLVRWFVHYPVVFGTYRLKNWSRSPFLMESELQQTIDRNPGILVSNYGNYFYDHIIGLMVGPVWPFSFVPDSIARIPVLGLLFQMFRRIPIVRTSDARYSPEERRSRNEKTYARIADLLKKGHWLSIFPEADAEHSSTIRSPLRPGAAHVALRAESEAGWALGVRVYVYGTNYENKFAGRSNIFFRWAQPIEPARYRELYERSPQEAEAALMAEIEAALHAVVLEAPSLEQLSDAHRLAYQRNPQVTFPLVQQALQEVSKGRSTPEKMRRLICHRRQESIPYQVLAMIMLTLGWALGWAFRAFGRLCATERSQEMSYQLILWFLVLITGAIVNESHWAKFQILATWIGMNAWLWAWRRGVVDERM